MSDTPTTTSWQGYDSITDQGNKEKFTRQSGGPHSGGRRNRNENRNRNRKGRQGGNLSTPVMLKGDVEEVGEVIGK